MTKRALSLSIFLLLASASFQAAIAGPSASFRYPLSNFEGTVRSQWAKLATDPERNEVYALHQRANDIRIFDEHGMEIFAFGENFPRAVDLSIGEDGNIFILTSRYETTTIHRCNYRGEKISEITLKNVPYEFSKFKADRLVYRHGSFYLADSNRSMVVVADVDGLFRQGYDLHAILEQLSAEDESDDEELSRDDTGINGFDVDRDGNILFTIAAMFSAFRMSDDGTLVKFGRPGSAPSKFGVTGGITSDDHGYIYVADRLRCVVLVFNSDLQFQMEFGYRGNRPSNLIVPDDLAIDSSGNVYVGQAANRGVSVFQVVHQDVSKLDHQEVIESKTTDATSTGSEKALGVYEEFVSDREEFIVDHGGNTAETDSGKPDRALEGNASNQQEDEEDDAN
jgi:DNA-binding beta-propeller fold protein YncE